LFAFPERLLFEVLPLPGEVAGRLADFASFELAE
jgi:hypothetical protein